MRRLGRVLGCCGVDVCLIPPPALRHLLHHRLRWLQHHWLEHVADISIVDGLWSEPDRGGRGPAHRQAEDQRRHAAQREGHQQAGEIGSRRSRPASLRTREAAQAQRLPNATKSPGGGKNADTFRVMS